MRAVMNNSWTRAARCAALAALLCVPQSSWGQNDLSSGPPSGLGGYSDDFGSLFAPKSADSVFEQYASLSRLAVAWKEMNSSSMTDVALQFAEGERVLLRSHKLLTASQAFDLAIRLASENKDKDSLARLAKALEKSGDKDRLAQVNLALKTAGAARSTDPDLNSDDPKTVLVIQAVQSQIQSARVAGDRNHLTFIEKRLVDLSLSDKQRAALKKQLVEANDSASVGKELAGAAQALDAISGIGRPSEDVVSVKGNSYTTIDLGSGDANGNEVKTFIAALQTVGDTPSLDNDDSPLVPLEDNLGKLSAASRYGYWYQATTATYNAPKIRSGGKKDWIWQYTNSGGIDKSTCCGQAAVATMLGYWNPTAYPDRTDNAYVQKLEKSHPPDGFSLKIGTSWQRMGTMARTYGLQTQWISGEAAVKTSIREGKPVMVMLDVAKDRAGGDFGLFLGMGGHWTVVYGYDTAGNYYITNWKEENSVNRKITGDRFRIGWGIQSNGDWLQPYSNLTKAAGTTGYALKVWR